ncbi:MAG TPA: LysR family transcriptional regulator [Microvirga sp.]|nr:LysR family transcriptional regulator [Microvirga sp.]
MILTIRQMEILVAAADTMNFSEAAERLGITQPSLSETIRRIEAELGLRLFERTTRSLTLTPDGRHAVAVAREVVRDFRLALETIAHRAKSRRARVSIAALPSIACAVLPAAVRGLLSQFPHAEVSVQDVLHERAVGLVADGLADMALTIRPARLEGLSFEELGSDPVHLVCRADHPLAASERVEWRELVPYPFVGLARTSSVRRLTDAAFTLSEVAVEPAYEVEQIPSAAALVESGLGVTALPALTLAMFKGTGLVVRPLMSPQMRRHVGLVTLSGRTLAEPAAALLEHIRASLARPL